MMHFDRGEILKHEITPEGFLNCYMRIARVGELKYKNFDGSERIEVVSHDVLFNKDSIDSFKGKPITLGHPPEKVDATNSRMYQRGLSTPYVVIDGDFLGVIATITDKETIDAIINKKAIEVSCGYDAATVPRSDGKFDQVQRIGNHIAIVERGRAGSEVKVILDSSDDSNDVWMLEEPISSENFNEKIIENHFDTLKENTKIPPINNSMKRTFKLDGIEFETEDLELFKHVQSVESKLDSYKDKLGSLTNEVRELKQKFDSVNSEYETLKTDSSANKGKLDALMAEKDGYMKKIDELNKQIENMGSMDHADKSDEEIKSEIEKRMDTWQQVITFLKDSEDEFKPDYKLDSVSIKRLYLAKRYPSSDLSNKDNAYIEGAFEIAIASEVQSKEDSESASKVDGLLVDVVSNRKDGQGSDKDPVSVSRKAYTDSLENAWQKV